MPVGMVGSYQAHWSTQQHKGQIKIQAWFGAGWGTTALTLEVESPEEMLVLVDLLRNEKPIWYDSDGGKIRTGQWEPVGEAE